MKSQMTQMKNDLYSLIREKGVQDQLKTIIRTQICSKLKEKEFVENKKRIVKNLHGRILGSLVAEQLMHSNCEYSLSVYLSETGLEDNILSRSELIEILHTNFIDLQSSESLFSNLIGQRSKDFQRKEMQVQTDSNEYSYSIEQQFMKIDHQYKAQLINQISKQMKPSSVSQEAQQKLKADYESDLLRFKEFQIQKIKLEMFQQWNNKYISYSTHLQSQYQLKINQIRKKQKNLNEQYTEKIKNFEWKKNEAEKNIRQKMELLEMKNIVVQGEAVNLQKMKKNVEDEMNKKEIDLKERIRKNDSLLVNQQQRIDFEVNTAKLAIQQEYQEKVEQFQKRKKFIDEEYGKLMGIKDTLDILKKENQRLSQQNENLRKENVQSKGQIRSNSVDLKKYVERIQYLKEEITQMKEAHTKMAEDKVNEQKKRKSLETEILSLRKRLDQSKQIEENTERKESEEDQITQKQDKGPSRDLALKLQLMKAKRKKEIQKFRLDDG